MNYQFADGDMAILREYRRNPQLTTDRLSRLLSRNVRSLQRRIEALRSMGYLAWLPIPNVRNGHMVSFPTYKGWSFLHAEGETDPPAGFNVATLPKREDTIRVETRSNKNFGHDLKIADTWVNLRDQSGKKGWIMKTWERLPAYIGFKVPDGYLIPDGFIRYATEDIVDGCAFVEVENSNPNVRENVQSILGKCDLYHAYWKSGEFERRWGAKNFRVIFLMRTEERVVNQCRLMKRKGRHYDSPRWYFTWYEAAENMAGKIFVTPKDFDRGVLYSLED
jgi:hypothetical protein